MQSAPRQAGRRQRRNNKRSDGPARTDHNSAAGMLSRLGQPTVAPTLLGIPQDCRETILEMILQNKPLAWNDTVIDDEVPVIQLNIPRVSGEDTRVPQYTISKDKIRVGNVKILAVCRQLHSEGAPIPYGRNSFVSYSFPHLKFRLSAVIGCRNMKFIRKLTLGLPLKHKSDPTIHLGGFLEFLKEKLPNLSELVLTTQFSRLGKVFVKNSADTRLGEEYRAMLNTSAWITCRHPQLRKAIWLAASGPVWKLHVFTPVLREGEIGSDDGYGDFANHNIRITHNPEEIFGNKAPSESTEKWIDTVLDDELSDYVDMCSLTVKILAEDRRHIIRKQPKISILPEIKKVTASDIILDSQAIRRTDWSELHAADPCNFALAPNATSSEPPRPVVSRTRDGEMYANYKALNNYLRDRFEYLSLKDKGRVTAKAVS